MTSGYNFELIFLVAGMIALNNFKALHGREIPLFSFAHFLKMSMPKNPWVVVDNVVDLLEVFA